MISTAHKVTTVNLFIIYNFYDIIKKINFEKGLKPEQSEQTGDATSLTACIQLPLIACLPWYLFTYIFLKNTWERIHF